MKKILLLIVSICAVAYSATADGYAYLEEGTDHTGIKVFFKALSPTATTDSVYTDATGYFTKELDTGTYTVHYSKDGHKRYEDNVQYLFSGSHTLQSVTLKAGNYKEVSGDVSGFWHADTIYLVVGFARISIGDSLEIEAGTKIEFERESSLIVQGKIFAIGLASDSIAFTSAQQDPSKGDWSSIELDRFATNCVFEYCIIEYGGYGVSKGNLYLESGYSGPLKFLNSSVRYSNNNGMYLSTIKSNISIQNSTFFSNNLKGISLEKSPEFLDIAYCKIYGNSLGIFVSGSRRSNNIRHNKIFSNSTGINSGGSVGYGGSIMYNEVFNNQEGITAGQDTVAYNVVYNNSIQGISGKLVSNNTIYSNGKSGIKSFPNAIITNNIVMNHLNGIDVGAMAPEFIGYNNVVSINDNYLGDALPLFIGELITANSNGDSTDAYYNLSQDPMMVDPENNDFYLITSSPNIDAGNPSSPKDPDSTIADIGAYYYDQSYPTAMFEVDTTQIKTENLIQFSDLSIEGSFGESIVAWSWGFGDGTTSTLQNPSHSYAASGKYSISLTVTDALGKSSTENKESYITSSVSSVSSFSLKSESNLQHVINHTPTFQYSFKNDQGLSQNKYHLLVLNASMDTLWDTGEIISNSSNIEYAGGKLIDGNDYVSYLKVNGGNSWSKWDTLNFHMNSVPSKPQAISPKDTVRSLPVILSIESNDAENDALSYNYFVYSDSALLKHVASVSGHDSPNWEVDVSLEDNKNYWWTAEALDPYEKSSLSEATRFYLNAVKEAPQPFALLSPAKGQNSLSATPTFIWETASDNDLNDQVSYRLFISSDTLMNDILRQTETPDTSVTLSNALIDSLKYYWRVEAIDLDSLVTSSETRSFVVGVLTSLEIRDELPTEFLLSQNYPNPFNPSTTISFSIPIVTNVELTIVDMLGKKVATLINGKMPVGNYKYDFNASGLASGVYLYMLKTKEYTQMKKMLLIK
ncbi:MAG: PKD domain-containing protein [Calditrichaeota bacterium]|nr:MAG: PKD domain-containing protein [Calditrichota bacterium]MBL1207993.1 PKD domain-containing protein [Calditrichota bacterium]NOG47830.1 PKD domain-containing protein [Calditrichota bacterium]